MTHHHPSESDLYVRQDRTRTYSPGLNCMMREVLQHLGDIDFHYDIELDRVERSAKSPEIKNEIMSKIRAAHQERRRPYVELLTTLRERQHRLAFGD